MPDETEQAAALPAVQPVVGEPIPAADTESEDVAAVFSRISHVVVTTTVGDIRRLAEKDPCVARLKREIDEARAKEMPSRIELESAKKQLRAAHQRLCQLQMARENRSAAIKMLRAQLYHRLTTIANKEENRRVNAIRQKISPRFRRREDGSLIGNSS